MSIPVSVVIITRNEAQRIKPVLEAVKWCNDIVVVDSGSDDGTVEICLQYGARVIQQQFLGFGAQKQAGVDAAAHDWILSLDADEVMSRETSDDLLRLTRSGPGKRAYYIRRQLVFMNKRFRFGRESRDYQLRFFNRNFARWNANEVHESVVFEGKPGTLKGRVDHYSYTDLNTYLKKFNLYTDLAARELKARGKQRSNLLLFFSFPWYLFKVYLIDGNILNGFPGFIWSILSAVYPIVKYSKARE